MNVGIIGCGLIGQKRAKNLAGAKLIACADAVMARAQQLADSNLCKAYAHWQELMEHPDVEIIIIATPHHLLAEITLAAIYNNKHVLVEKPAAKHWAELIPVMAAAKQTNVQIRVGFNHRYHRALRKAKILMEEGILGELLFLRARYGHGGRIGYDKEWRAIPEVSGGGELIDQGVHLIDLSRLFLGDFLEIDGFAHTYFWQMPVDDNAFLLLKTIKKQAAFLHVSCSEWKNIFSMEIYGRNGKIAIDGLGGSYGIERITHYRMLPDMGPPETTSWEFPMLDNSWELEFAEFIQDIKLGREPAANLNDAYQALKIVDEIYKKSSQ